MPTEAELEKIRQRNETLREQIAREQSKKAENLSEAARDLEEAQLLAEQASLEAQLASAKENAKVGVARSGNSDAMESARLRADAAAAALENPQGVVDTNAEDQPTGTTGKVKAVKDGVIEFGPDGSVTAVKSETKPESTSSSSTSTTTTSGSSSSSSTSGSGSSSSNGGNN